MVINSITQELLYWTQLTINNFGVLPLSISYSPPSDMRIYCVVMFLTCSYMEQNSHTNTSKYGVWETTSSMEMLQFRRMMMDHIEAISWDMQLLHELSSNGNQIYLLFSQIPSCLVWRIYLSSLHIRDTHSRFFTPSTISWKSYSWFRPPQLDSMWTWSYIYSFLWQNNDHISNWVTYLWKESCF